MALIYLLSALTLGATLARRIPFPLYRFEQAAMAVVLGLFLWTWIVMLTTIQLPYDVALPLIVTAVAAVTVALWSGGGGTARPLEGGRRAWIAWGIGTAAASGLIIRLFATHSLPADADGIWTAAAAWGDYGLHASAITHIAAATSLPTDMPLASGENMTYPFLVNVLSGMLMHGGMPLGSSMFWPGVLLALAILQLFISVGLRLFGRMSVALGGLVLILLSGSAAGTFDAWNDWRESGKGLFAFLGNVQAVDYSLSAGSNAWLSNMVVDGFLPQRTFLFGFGVGLIVLILLITAREQRSARLLWPAAVLVGLLPMAHAHTFIVAVTWVAALIAEVAWKRRAIPWEYVRPLAVALVLAAPQLGWQQFANGSGTGGGPNFGWMLAENGAVLPFWWANFGLFGIALLITPYVMRRHPQRFWMLPMLALLALTQLYLVQPNAYDNLKIIWWVYVVGGFFIASMVATLIRRHRAWLAVAIPVGILVLSPGALAITRDLQIRWQFASRDDVQLADWLKANTPPDAVIAATDRPNPPPATLAGRSMLLGYRSWLINFSIPFADRERALRAALVGNFEDPGLQGFGVDYLVVATTEPAEWTIDRAALARRPVMWQNASWQVYDVTPTSPAPLSPVATTPSS